MNSAVTFKRLRDFNYAFDKQRLYEHLFKELKSVPTTELAVESELCFLPLVIFKVRKGF